jgi:hypothetical protein
MILIHYAYFLNNKIYNSRTSNSIINIINRKLIYLEDHLLKIIKICDNFMARVQIAFVMPKFFQREEKWR